MGKTDENLKEAFAGESQANRKYLLFAGKADEEELPVIAKLFRAAAQAETVHALNHADVMEMAGSTLDNLQDAADGEAAEFREMYPAFISQAEAEGNEEARETFDFANQVEEIHHGFFSRAKETLKAGGDLPQMRIFVCRGCGNTVEGEAPEKCPICGAPRSWFDEIE